MSMACVLRPGQQRRHHGRGPVSQRLGGAWDRRDELSLVDALYVELAERLDVPIISADDWL